MQISDEYLDKFISLYEEKYDIRLSREEALPMAINLVNLVAMVYKPIKKNKSDVKNSEKTQDY